MKDKTVIALARYACGTAIMITSVIAKVDGVLLAMAMVLLGVPVELAKKEETNGTA